MYNTESFLCGDDTDEILDLYNHSPVKHGRSQESIVQKKAKVINQDSIEAFLDELEKDSIETTGHVCNTPQANLTDDCTNPFQLGPKGKSMSKQSLERNEKCCFVFLGNTDNYLSINYNCKTRIEQLLEEISKKSIDFDSKVSTIFEVLVGINLGKYK